MVESPGNHEHPVAQIRSAVGAAVQSVGGSGIESADFKLERPPKPDLGDYSTNAAMLLAPLMSKPPRDVAAELCERLVRELGGRAERVEIAGPGFVNVFLSDRWHREVVRSLLGSGGLGERAAGADDVLIEFVSANPTGPLTVASGRGAAFGDSLGRMLEFLGHSVQREYYLNDRGLQVRKFAESIAARIAGKELPEDGYEGEYVAELAAELATGWESEDLDALGRLGVEAMRKRIEASLERFGVRFDAWFSERSLVDSGAMNTAIDRLRADGHVYDSDGAVWMRTTDFGDDKDRVLLRADGEPTYFATDIAYHLDKLERARLVISPWGADHHGYVPRVRGAIAALGEDPDRMTFPIIQLMHVVEAGERAQMSKRRGEFVTLDELIDEIGVDAARFFLVQHSHDTTLDLDLDLARSRSQDNPVYYVQYAHARIAGILRKAEAEGLEGPDPFPNGSGPDAALDAVATQQSERALIKRLLDLPGEVSVAAELRAPHRICAHATATAADFHAFYRDCQVVGAEGDGVEQARLELCVATRDVLAQTLDLLGVSAPDEM